MNKEGLINAVSKTTGMTKKDTRTIINGTINCIKDIVASNESITLSGFGTFSKQHRKAKNTTNPITHEPMVIEEKNVIKFKAGKSFGEMVN